MYTPSTARHKPWIPGQAVAGSVSTQDLGEPRNRDLIQSVPDRAPFWMGIQNGRLVLTLLTK